MHPRPSFIPLPITQTSESPAHLIGRTLIGPQHGHRKRRYRPSTTYEDLPPPASSYQRRNFQGCRTDDDVLCVGAGDDVLLQCLQLLATSSSSENEQLYQPGCWTVRCSFTPSETVPSLCRRVVQTDGHKEHRKSPRTKRRK